MKTNIKKLCFAFFYFSLAFFLLNCGGDKKAEKTELEILHWWTSGGESKAVATLKKDFEDNGGTWIDMPVAGGNGMSASQVLKTRVLAGDPPGAYQMKGPSIQQWYEEGGITTLIDSVAKENNWDSLLPASIANHLKCGGEYCAAPVNVHRVDQFYSNPKVLEQVGVSEPPKNWDEFNEIADKLKAKGITPLAHGGQPWQDATIFEFLVLSIGGNDFYKKAIVDLDMSAIESDTMKQIFTQFRKLRSYVDDNFSGRDWNLATSMVINGEAGFQIMGDWAKGEFLNAGKKIGEDFSCNTIGNGYLYNVDSFAFFNVNSDGKREGQKLLAKLIMGKDFQKTFNMIKGSIPVRNDMDLSDFDDCAKISNKDMLAAAESGGLLPSFAHGMALRDDAKGAIQDVVTNFFNSEQTPEEGVKLLSEAVQKIK